MYVQLRQKYYCNRMPNYTRILSLPNAPHFVLGPILCKETSFELHHHAVTTILKAVVVTAAFLGA
jgi:hypothetical protein